MGIMNRVPWLDPAAPGATPRKDRADLLTRAEYAIEDVVGVSPRKEDGTLRAGSVAMRLAARSDLHAQGVLNRVAAARDQAALTFRYAETAVNDPTRGRPGDGAR